MFVEALDFLELVLADTYEVSTDLPYEAQENPHATCADSEDILMRLIILVQFEVCRVVCVCLYDPQIISVKISKLSDDLATGDFFRERASMK